MRLFKKLAVITVTVAVMLSLVGINAFAATTAQDGLDVTLATDKEKYEKEEYIGVSLLVKNTNSTAVDNVVLKNLVPNGYKLSDSYEDKKYVGMLKAGETVDLNVVYVPLSTGTTEDSQISKVTDDDTAMNTGDSSPRIAVIIIVVLASSALMIACFKSKKGRKILSLVMCLTLLSSSLVAVQIDTKAAENQTKTISVSEKVVIDDKTCSIGAVVEYVADTENLESSGESEISEIPESSIESEISEIPETSKNSEPFDDTDVDPYFKENGTVLSVVDVKDSDRVPTYKEVCEFYAERGFEGYPVMTEYTLDGDSFEMTEIDKNSSKKAPLYEMFYGTPNEVIWCIYVVNGSISAYPISYNLESERNAPLVISESDSIVSYDSTRNKFCENIPNESAVIVKKVNRIDAKTLDSFTNGGLSKL